MKAADLYRLDRMIKSVREIHTAYGLPSPAKVERLAGLLRYEEKDRPADFEAEVAAIEELMKKFIAKFRRHYVAGRLVSVKRIK